MSVSLNAAESKKSRAPKPQSLRVAVTLPGRILAIDYGRRRIGIAISDELRITARPVTILERNNRSELIRRLREMAREYGARQIIVGYPLNLDGTSGEMAEEAARFANRLRKELGVEVELVDERLTSWAAEQTIAETGRRTRRKDSGPHQALDDLAAAIFLRDYLERNKFNRPASQADKD
jgi:putative Holliday junction resolvase